jgi:L-fuconolactonase
MTSPTQLPSAARPRRDLPIIDAHHHLWDHSVGRAATATTATTATAAELAAWQGGGRQRVWLLHEVLADIQASGHNIVDTVFVQAGAFHRASGPEELRPTGESEFVQGVAAMCESGLYAPPATVIGAAIVGTCDLRHSNVEAVLRAHMRSRNFRGIRMLRRINPPVPQEVAGGERDVALDRGFALLERFGLSFDCWQTSGEERDYASVPRVTALARRYPGVTIILNHLGCPVGPAMSADEFAQWRVDLKELAECCPNVVCKVGGIAMPVNGWGWERGARPVTSEEMCEATLPYYGHAIDCFGPERCMFE